jgi:hypothetical protein
MTRRGVTLREGLLAFSILLSFPLTAQSRPFTPFDVIAPATLDIAYDPDFCSVPACPLSDFFGAGLIAATTAPLDLSRTRFFVTTGSMTPELLALDTVDPWVTGTLLPGEVAPYYPGVDPALVAALLPGEVLLPQLGSPGALRGEGLRTLVAFRETLTAVVPLDVRIVLNPRHDAAVATFTILANFTPTGHPPPGDGVIVPTVTSTQRVAARAVPEPKFLTFSVVGGLALILRRRGLRPH